MSKIDESLVDLFDAGVHWAAAGESERWKTISVKSAKDAVDRAVLRGKIEVLEELEYHDMNLKNNTAIHEQVASLEAGLKKLEENGA